MRIKPIVSLDTGDVAFFKCTTKSKRVPIIESFKLQVDSFSFLKIFLPLINLFIHITFQMLPTYSWFASYSPSLISPPLLFWEKIYPEYPTTLEYQVSKGLLGCKREQSKKWVKSPLSASHKYKKKKLMCESLYVVQKSYIHTYTLIQKQ